MLPRHKRQLAGRKRPHLAAREPLSHEEVKDISEKMKTFFRWEHEPREHQIKATVAQLQMRDVLR